MKAMPARHVASRGVDVIRPLMYCAEDDLREYATRLEFPILAVQFVRLAAGGQALATARRQTACFISWMRSAATAKTSGRTCSAPCRTCGPRILLDRDLRGACGLDGHTGEPVDERAARIFRAPGVTTTSWGYALTLGT